MRIKRSRKKANTVGGALRKELVNEIGSKANKAKSKGYGNWAQEAQNI